MTQTQSPQTSQWWTNPYLICDTCYADVHGYDFEHYANTPCGHPTYYNACATWSPVRGCTCHEMEAVLGQAWEEEPW